MKLLFAQEYEFSDWVYGTTIAINSKKKRRKKQRGALSFQKKEKKTISKLRVIKQWRQHKLDPMIQTVKFNKAGA